MSLTTLLHSIPLLLVNFVTTALQVRKTQPCMKQAFTKEQNIIAQSVVFILAPQRNSMTTKDKSTKKTSIHVIIADSKQTVFSHQTTTLKLIGRSKTRMQTCVIYQTDTPATSQILLIQMIVATVYPDLLASFSQKSSAFKMVHVSTGIILFANFLIFANLLTQKYANFKNSVIFLKNVNFFISEKTTRLFQTEKSINNPSL